MELNESKLIESEMTIRLLRLTSESMETRRSIIRWLALSMGIVNPRESRLSAIAVFDSVLYFQFILKKDPDVHEMIEYINKAWEPINEKTLRYHLLQLKKMKIIKNSKARYSMAGGAELHAAADAWIDNYFDTMIGPVKTNIKRMMQELKGRQ
ncbi:MAG: hypothetical protein M1331_03055 [Candidatus Marsarchaeota archaeon]|nr:hypothetical protein [Candidatus Marsarchaeota archaeon]MCL5106344.1 hypothetical protein [Candidatus Marsarchaeota archaeon]